MRQRDVRFLSITLGDEEPQVFPMSQHYVPEIGITLAISSEDTSPQVYQLVLDDGSLVLKRIA